MYQIYRFGNIDLSPFNNDFTLSPVPAKTNLLSTTGGMFDSDGEGRSRQQFPFPLSYKCVVMEDVYNNNRATLDALRAAVGTRAKLYRRAANDGAVHWCIARLVAMPHDWPYTQRSHFVVSFDFQQLTPWQGFDHADWRLDDGYEIDDGLLLDPALYTASLPGTSAITILNSGNLPVTDVLLTVKAGANPLNNIVFFGPDGVWLQWSGTIPAASELVIDTGAQSVLLDGVNAYQYLSLPVYHTVPDWFYIPPGSTLVAIAMATTVGEMTGSKWTVNFRDWWA